uniref:Adipokinetic hormone n=1 Tax=Timema shepardi TaxID=629360 RepID=A0A7R9B622_TIMSH|nr:unnamed protein product [Timema shepardi]
MDVSTDVTIQGKLRGHKNTLLKWWHERLASEESRVEEESWMVRLLVILLVSSCLLVAFCGAQVNFSPSWGKRSITPENCKTTMDSLMYINKLIQEPLLTSFSNRSSLCVVLAYSRFAVIKPR